METMFQRPNWLGSTKSVFCVSFWIICRQQKHWKLGKVQNKHFNYFQYAMCLIEFKCCASPGWQETLQSASIPRYLWVTNASMKLTPSSGLAFSPVSTRPLIALSTTNNDNNDEEEWNRNHQKKKHKVFSSSLSTTTCLPCPQQRSCRLPLLPWPR